MRFSEVVGQEDVKRRLRTSVQAGRIPHAQMFFGAEGSGTLPMAIAYAQYVSCTNRSAEDSCDECPNCRKIKKLAHPDLHFTFPVNTSKKVSKDAVSDDYISEWRELVLQNAYFTSSHWYDFIGLENKQGLINKRDSDSIIRKLSLKSYEADYKIMIIWLPENMNASSSNVLLKLIEEPPSHTLFLLVSEDPDKVLLTISSRTQPVKLPPLRKEDLQEAIGRNYEFSGDELELVSRLAQGNYIQAREVLQTSEENERNFENFVEIMRLCYKRSFLDINAWVDGMALLGREKLKSFFEYSLRLVRENFIANINNPELNYMTAKEAEFSKRFHPYINGNNIVKMYEEFGAASADIERNGYAKIVLFSLTLKIMKLIRPGG